MATKGQRRVRVSFNPSQDSIVDQIKQKTAELIDLLDSTPVKTGPSEKARLLALAQTEYENAAMWAVKCLTTTEEHES